ncbi:MAG: copper resistance protein B [Pseudomonadota bacterium]|nr:copper resistance protein B [Pseudomonadota bacterium]
MKMHSTALIASALLIALPAHAQHSGHDQHPPQPATAADVPKPRTELPDFLSAPTAEDIAAAFPDMHGMDMSDHMVEDPWITHLRVDQLEHSLKSGGGSAWEMHGWTGKTHNRLWLKSHGERGDHGSHGNVELMWGHATGPWWDRMIGVRRDFSGGKQRDWVGVGVHGHALYKFDVDATAYLGSAGRAMLDASASYNVLLTNRLILQPDLGISLHAKDDATMGNGRGLSELHGGLRLRHEFTHEFAPYIGWRYSRAYGRSADMRQHHGEAVSEHSWVVGVRLWF